MSGTLLHDFKSDLAFSHDLEGAEFWREIYEQFFPGNVAVIRHSADGDHQRLGIDTTVVMGNAKIYRLDEKTRRNDYGDILLEEFSDLERHIPGWVVKPVLSDFILYAIPKAGKAYLLPCAALQTAWARNCETWRRTCQRVEAHNRDPRTGREWASVSWAIPERDLFQALGRYLRANFEPETASAGIRSALEK